MVDTNLHWKTNANLAGMGLPPLDAPTPDFGGKLFGDYLLGKDYWKFSTDPVAKARKGLLDWSGNNRHLPAFGDAVLLDLTFRGTTTSQPSPLATPFTQDELTNKAEENEGYSVIAFANTTSTAKAISLVRSTSTNPNTQLALVPQDTGGAGYIRANTVNAAGTVFAAYAPINDGIIGANSMFVGVYKGDGSLRDVYAKSPSGPLRHGTNSTAKALDGPGKFWIGIEQGAGAGTTDISKVSFFRGLLTEEEILLAQIRWHNWNLAAETGQTYYVEAP